MRQFFLRCLAMGLVLGALASRPAGAVGRRPAPAQRVTILYDAFGNRAGLTRDWGFAALVEYGGHRILFDTGDNAGIFAANVRGLGIDLSHLDFAVISHRHGDHIAGIQYLLSVNPGITIYAPSERFGIFGSSLPGSFLPPDTLLPDSLRYFDGHPPARLSFGSAWPSAHFTLVDSTTEIVPGVSVILTVSDRPGTLELRELSLAISTPAGLVLLVGCSHPGIETILQASRPVGDHVFQLIGGLHLVATPDSAIARIAVALHDQWRIDWMSPGHCTGEPAFAELRRVFGARYLYAGLGTVLDLP
jgi:7,8-dihydropterin-6-yl-methyl-4-(beta-D-ribofuranosyl)aminobenzene 5'-phosphate synthase